jgi:hypothetical protein
MRTWQKLAAFAALLALLFAGGALAGTIAGPEPESAPADDAMAAMEGVHDGEEATTAKTVRGLAVSDDGLTLRVATTQAARGERFPLSFEIVDSGGRTVKDFDVEHTKRMHLIVVRRDTSGFQHLHPLQARDGSWSTPVKLPEPGTYRVFADFATDGVAHTLATDLSVDGAVRTREMPAPSRSVIVDGMRVTLDPGTARAGEEAELGFSVTHRGKRVTPEPYLGAMGHLVALREGDLAFLHVHPDEDRLRFMAEFPSPGRYRLFLQFKVDGRVHTAAFSEEVGR